ncbi:very large A-kinase anchor protein [Leptodactylus fuscus]|uniref:very large A-kinase anchor protein n=1 Tax=Leptodactylus fuscus TaxID=238119 RepID=UPI003F4E80B6
MNTRRRSSTWQDEVARSFSRLFSRTSSQEKEEESAKDPAEEQDKSDRSLSRLFFRSSSQEKKDGSDRTEHGEEQERSHSPSRLFFRKISQENKGGNDNASPAKGNKEESERSRVFSRLFTRTSSQEKEEDSDSSRGAKEDHSRHEENHTDLTLDRHEDLSSPEPEQVSLEQTSSPPQHNISEPQEEKDGEFAQNAQILDSEKQSRENFFHFIGNLFHFSPKSSLGNSKQGVGGQEPSREHEEAQAKNNLDKEDLDQERTLDDHSGEEETSEEHTARHEQESPEVNEGENPKDLLEDCEDAADGSAKLGGPAQKTSAVTYGTYRGSRRIRKLLKRRASVNSPIPEKEETAEISPVGDGTSTENHLMLHELVNMEPVPDRNCQDEIPPSKLHIKMKPKLESLDQNSELHNREKEIPKAKNSELLNDLETEDKSTSIGSNIGEFNAENSSEIEEGQQPDSKQYVVDAPYLNVSNSSEIVLPNPGESLEDLQPTHGECLNVSGHLNQNVENSEDHSKGIAILKNLEPNNEGRYTDLEPKTMDISDTVRHLQPNSNEVSKQPEDLQPKFTENVRFPEVLPVSVDDDTKTETDPSPKVMKNVNILLNTKENIEHCLPGEQEHANTDISNPEKCETLSVMDNLHSEVNDTSVKIEKLEERSKENTKVPDDLENCEDVNLESVLQPQHLEMVLDSGDCTKNNQVVEVNLPVEDKTNKDHSDNLCPTTHNRSEGSSDNNCEGFSLPVDYLKPETEIRSNTIDLQPNELLVSSSSIDVEPNAMDDLSIEGQLPRDVCQKQPKQEVDTTFIDSEDNPNLVPHLNENSTTAKDLQQIGNIEHLQTNAIIPEHELQNKENLLKTELQLKTQSELKDIPNLDLQMSETSKSSKDLQQTEGTEHLPKNTNGIPQNELQSNEELLKTEILPNTNESFELNDTYLGKIVSESEDIPNLDLQQMESSRTSKNLTQITGNLQTKANIIPENNPKNNDLLNAEPNAKVSSQLKELNHTFLEKASSESEDLQLNKMSKQVGDNANIVLENDPPNNKDLLQSNAKETFMMKESSDESPLKSGIITKMIESQKPNIHVATTVSDGIHTQAEEPSKVNLCLEPNSESHIPEVSNGFLNHKVSQSPEFVSDDGLTETSSSNALTTSEDNVHVDKPDGTVKELNIKPDIFYDNPEKMTGPESSLNDISSLNNSLEAATSRNISFDNGIECRSPSPATRSDSPSYIDCNDVQFDSPNDSGIVSQAYTPDEHVLFKSFPSEIIIKNVPDPFAVNQKDEESLVPKPEQNVPILQNKEPLTNINNVSEHGSLIDGDSIKITTPDKLTSLHSDVYVAKVSLKTVNVEEVKIPPYGLCSDIISVVKLESPTFTKEVVCIPNLSPTDGEKTFQVFHCVEDQKDFVTNQELSNDRAEHPTVNNCEKHLKNCSSETDKLPSFRGNDVTMNLVSDLPHNGNGESVTLLTCIEKESQKIMDKSPAVLIENLKNNNINVCTNDNIINASLQAQNSEREVANEGLSRESMKELRLGESLPELNPDSKMIHREKLSDLLLHSALLHDVPNTNEIISSSSPSAKMILQGKTYSESSNELFEQKANELIFSVLHSAIDEFHSINQSHRNIQPLPDIRHLKENLSENHVDLKDHLSEVLDKCPEKPEHTPMKDTDLIMSMAVGIVNDVISSSKKVVVSDIVPNGLGKDVTTNEASEQKPQSDINGFSTHDPVEDATNSNHVGSSLGYDNVLHLPPYEINSNVLEAATELSPNVESRLPRKHSSLDDLCSLVTDLHKNDVDRTIESNVLRRTEDEEHLNFSQSPRKADEYNLLSEGYTNGDLMFDDLYCDRQMESISLGTEGSMEDLTYNDRREESSISSEFSDFLQFSVYKTQYVELSGSDDDSPDEEKDCGSEQASGNDSFLPVHSRRVRVYPYALSPIYEDDSACEDNLSNSSSPRCNEGATARNSGHDHTSILSLLQSVSDRLKEADLEETSPDERFSALSNEESVVNDRFNKEGSVELEDITSPSKTCPDVPSTLEDGKNSFGKRTGLFITKSYGENKPNLVLGRQSLLLNLTSQSKTYGAKSSVDSSSVKSETLVSPTAESTPCQSIDLSPSTAAVNVLALEPTSPIQSSALDAKLRVSPKSAYYQYFHDAHSYLSSKEDDGSAQKNVEEPKETAEPETESADSDSLKFNPRPGKVILSDIIDQENKTELKADVLDATSWEFPNGVNIRVIRGCWILYEKPHFEGQAHVLEEGEAVLRHLWDLPGANAKPDKITIGSVKRVVKDYLPEVVISSLQDESDTPIFIRTEVPSLENLVGRHPRSLVVNSGVWLAYRDPQYNGTVTVLGEGCELPQIQDSGLKSMRPLKMGGLKVQLPSDPKIIIYEKPHFQGWSREITEHVGSIGALTCDGENSTSQDIGSIQVLGGIWVGYENERYKGHQYLLEEGDYEDWHSWGGYDSTLQSIRYLQADFLEPSVTLYETDEEDGKQINLSNQAIPDLEMAGFNTRTRCIDVKKGMWVAYQQKHFCGQQYILEKGRYKTYMDWGGSNNTIMSIRPVLLEPLGRNDVKHLIKVYTGPEFQGEAMDVTQGVYNFTSFIPMSFKVLRGCWLLFYEDGSCHSLCVLEEGHFPDLASCGCPTAVIKYIKPIDYVFAEPSISLFALDSCEGRELHFEEAVTSVLSKDLHFYAQSVWVRRGLWIAFEGANFLGRQMLLDPQKIVNWSQFSGWKAIGSLRPVKQPPVYFMVKNRDKDKYLTVTGKDSRATFVSVAPRNGQTTQIWYFCRGFLKSKANDSCLDVIGGKNIPGSKVSLWAEHGKTRQKWRINKDGTITSYISDDLVLDLKGGNYYDQNYIVVNKVQENVLTQKWDIEIL